MSAFSREIRSFLVVSQSSSIREAAERLNISAPAVSRQIQILERSYGTQLLVRSANGVALTAEGEALRTEVLSWFAADTAFSQRLHKDNASSDVLRLRMGIMEGLGSTLMPRLTDYLESLFGNLDLDLTVGPTSDIVDRAESLELDIIVAFNVPRLSRLSVVHSEEHYLGVVYGHGCGPSGDGPISLAEVLEYPLCLPTAALSMHTRLLAEILSERVNPRVVISSNSISVLREAVVRNKGIGFFTWLDVCHEVEAGNLSFRPLANKRLTQNLSISICRGNNLGDATGKVIQGVREMLESLGK